MTKKTTEDILEAFDMIDERYILEADNPEILESLKDGTRFTSSKFVSSRRKPRKRFVPVLAAAAIGLFAVTGIAAVTGNLQSIFPDSFRSTKAQNLVNDSGLDVTISGQEHIPDGVKSDPESLAMWKGWPVLSDNSALISITQTAFDGKWFYLTAAKTENGKKYDLNEDRMWVNEEEFGPVCSTDEDDLYSLQADLSSLNLTSDFEVILPLSVYSKDGKTRYQNQEISFTVSYVGTQTEGSAWTLSSTITFSHPDVMLTVTSLSVSATRVEAIMHAEKTSETPDGYSPILTILSPEDGKEAEFDDPASWKNVENSHQENEDGSEDWTLIYTGFTKIPEKLTVATRLVSEDTAVRNEPILYKDEITCS